MAPYRVCTANVQNPGAPRHFRSAADADDSQSLRVLRSTARGRFGQRQSPRCDSRPFPVLCPTNRGRSGYRQSSRCDSRPLRVLRSTDRGRFGQRQSPRCDSRPLRVLRPIGVDPAIVSHRAATAGPSPFSAQLIAVDPAIVSRHAATAGPSALSAPSALSGLALVFLPNAFLCVSASLR
jgi:hypothetical protein